MKLLLFDDQLDQLEPIRNGLLRAWSIYDREGSDPLSIDVFESAADAIDALKNDKFDIVLADTVAPDATQTKNARAGAWRIFEFLRSDPSSRPSNLAFIAMTGDEAGEPVLRDIQRNQLRLAEKRWAFGLSKPQKIGISYNCDGVPNNEWYFFVTRLMKCYKEAALRKSFLTGPIAEFVGTSARRQSINTRILAAIEERSAVYLVSGEYGTGKEQVARYIHSARHFPDEPQIVDCTDPEAEIEIFGAYQGAVPEIDRAMAATLTFSHTILLDNFDPDIFRDGWPELFAAIVKLVSTGTFCKLKSTNREKFEGVVIIGSTKPIDRFVFGDHFRISKSAIIDLPALRDTREDLPAILEHAWEQSRTQREISKEAWEFLTEEYDWPKNFAQMGWFVEEATRAGRANPVLEREEAEEIVGFLVPHTEAETMLNALENAGGIKSTASDTLTVSEAAELRRDEAVRGAARSFTAVAPFQLDWTVPVLRDRQKHQIPLPLQLYRVLQGLVLKDQSQQGRPLQTRLTYTELASLYKNEACHNKNEARVTAHAFARNLRRDLKKYGIDSQSLVVTWKGEGYQLGKDWASPPVLYQSEPSILPSTSTSRE